MHQPTMHIDRTAVRSSLGRDRIETISKLLLAIVGLLFIGALVRAVPGTAHVVPMTDVAAGTILRAVATLVIVGLLVYLSSAIGQLLSTILVGPPILVESTASIARWSILLAAIVVGHAGLVPIASVLGSFAWLLDIVALVLAIPVLLVIALQVYVALDPAARYLADSVTGI